MAIGKIQIENEASFPPGIIVPWMGGYFGDSSNEGYISIEDSSIETANLFLTKYGWVVCDGSLKNDTRSYFFNGEGRHLPNLTDNRFLMGANAVGGKGGSNVLTDHTHAHALTAAGQGGGSHDHTYSLTAAGQTLETTNVASGNQSANHNHAVTGGAHTHNYLLASHQANPLVSGTGPDGYLIGAWPSTATSSTAHTHTVGNNSANHTHTTNITHTHAASSVSGTINSTVHTHDSSSVSGTVGSGNVASSTENRPKYLSCFYIIKVR